MPEDSYATQMAHVRRRNMSPDAFCKQPNEVCKQRDLSDISATMNNCKQPQRDLSDSDSKFEMSQETKDNSTDGDEPGLTEEAKRESQIESVTQSESVRETTEPDSLTGKQEGRLMSPPRRILSSETDRGKFFAQHTSSLASTMAGSQSVKSRVVTVDRRTADKVSLSWLAQREVSESINSDSEATNARKPSSESDRTASPYAPTRHLEGRSLEDYTKDTSADLSLELENYVRRQESKNGAKAGSANASSSQAPASGMGPSDTQTASLEDWFNRDLEELHSRVSAYSSVAESSAAAKAPAPTDMESLKRQNKELQKDMEEQQAFISALLKEIDDREGRHARTVPLRHVRAPISHLVASESTSSVSGVILEPSAQSASSMPLKLPASASLGQFSPALTPSAAPASRALTVPVCHGSVRNAASPTAKAGLTVPTLTLPLGKGYSTIKGALTPKGSAFLSPTQTSPRVPAFFSSPTAKSPRLPTFFSSPTAQAVASPRFPTFFSSPRASSTVPTFFSSPTLQAAPSTAPTLRSPAQAKSPTAQATFLSPRGTLPCISSPTNATFSTDNAYTGRERLPASRLASAHTQSLHSLKQVSYLPVGRCQSNSTLPQRLNNLFVPDTNEMPSPSARMMAAQRPRTPVRQGDSFQVTSRLPTRNVLPKY